METEPVSEFVMAPSVEGSPLLSALTCWWWYVGSEKERQSGIKGEREKNSIPCLVLCRNRKRENRQWEESDRWGELTGRDVSVQRASPPYFLKAFWKKPLEKKFPDNDDDDDVGPVLWHTITKRRVAFKFTWRRAHFHTSRSSRPLSLVLLITFFLLHYRASTVYFVSFSFRFCKLLACFIFLREEELSQLSSNFEFWLHVNCARLVKLFVWYRAHLRWHLTRSSGEYIFAILFPILESQIFQVDFVTIINSSCVGLLAFCRS